MNKYIILILSILLFNGIPLLAEPFKVPPIIPNEKGTIVTEYKDGGLRWKADWKTDIYIENGETKFKLVIKAKGLTSPFRKDMTWRSVSIWKAEDEFIPLESETRIKDLRGNLRKQYDITSDTLIVEGIVYALRTLPFGTDGTTKAKILSNEPELYNVEFKERGIEKIKTKDGEIECYKVEIVPKLGVLGVFKILFPKTYFWFTVEPPHRWVRYEGLENGVGTPEVVMEVTNFKDSPS